MEPHRHLEILRAEGALVTAIDPAALDAPVPAVGEWTAESVVRHLGKVHRWVAATFRQDPTGPPADARALTPMPKGPDCLPAYRDALDDLLVELDAREPSTPAASFIGEPVDVAWWTRRQAHEVAIHRMDIHDAAHAAGGPAPQPFAVDGAADGIDEWARLFLATRFTQRHGPLPAGLDGRSIHLHGTDDPAPPDGAEWLLRFADGAVAVETVHAKGDVALRGSANDLLLTLWRRRPLEGLEVFGDADLAARLLDVARF